MYLLMVREMFERNPGKISTPKITNQDYSIIPKIEKITESHIRYEYMVKYERRDCPNNHFGSNSTPPLPSND